MATLEKIRAQKKLLVGVIFTALVLFIFTCIDDPFSLFQDRTTAVKVNGEKISIESVTQRSNKIQQQEQMVNQQRRAQGLPEQNTSGSETEFNAAAQLIDETLLQQEFESLGLAVTEAEIVEFLRNLSEAEIAQLRASGDLEKQISEQLMYSKFIAMVQGGFNANKLDKLAFHNEASTTYGIEYVGTSVYSNSTPATDEEIEKYYAGKREEFKLDEPKRYVRYVYLDIEPSQQDFAKAQHKVTTDVDAIIADPSKFEEIAYDGTYEVRRNAVTAAELAADKTPGVSTFAKEAAPNDVKILSSRAGGENPEIIFAKFNSLENKVVTAKVNQVILDGTVNADSVVNQLNAGANVEGLAGVAQVSPIDLPLEGELKMLMDSVTTLGAGKYLAANAQVLVGLVSLNEPEDVYDFTVVKYAVVPSSATIENLTNRINEFLIAAPDAESFNEDNAIKNGLTMNYALVGQSDYALNQNLADASELVSWVMNTEVGKVSKLKTTTSGNRMIAAAVVSEFKEYVPVTFPDMHMRLATEALADRNTKAIIDTVAGKGTSLAEYAAVMNNAPVQKMSRVNLSSPAHYQFGELRGHKVGDVVGPFRWANQVIVANIVEANESEMPYDEASAERQFSSTVINPVFTGGLRGLLLNGGEVEYDIHRFHKTGEE